MTYYKFSYSNSEIEPLMEDLSKNNVLSSCFTKNELYQELKNYSSNIFVSEQMNDYLLKTFCIYHVLGEDIQKSNLYKEKKLNFPPSFRRSYSLKNKWIPFFSKYDKDLNKTFVRDKFKLIIENNSDLKISIFVNYIINKYCMEIEFN